MSVVMAHILYTVILVILYRYLFVCLEAYTPVPLRFWLILRSSEARFISSGHLRKTIVSQSDESDLCLLTIRSVSDVFGVV